MRAFFNEYWEYERGYTDALASMRNKRLRQRKQAQDKRASRKYFIKQKATGVAMLLLTVAAAWALDGDITIAAITVPVGLMLIFSKEMVLVNDYYFETRERQEDTRNE